MNQWKEIWNKQSRVNKIILEALIKADGFDSGAGSFSVDNWMEYTQQLFDKMDIKEGQSIFDVGCGSGAFIYPLYLQKYIVGGCDYSMTLIELADTVMKDLNFIIKEASKIDTDNKFDFVVSHSVFHYFKDLNYAKMVIKKMINKANYKICIFDINDIAKQEEYHKVRMKTMGEYEYKKKYVGLNHLFYSKKWFENLANEFNLNIHIFDQSYEKYENSSLRFNVIMEK